MKIIGLPDYSIQKVFRFLNQKVEVGFMNDKKNLDVLLVPTVEYYLNNAFERKKKGFKCKVLILMDCIEQLKLIEGIQIISGLSDQFVEYIKNRTTMDYPKVKRLKNNYLYDILENYQTSIFQREIQPLLYKGIMDKKMRPLIRKVIVHDIFSLIKKDFKPAVLSYKEFINEKRLQKFIDWLGTDEAKEFNSQLLRKEKGKLLDSFEVSYLHSVLNSEEM